MGLLKNAALSFIPLLFKKEKKRRKGGVRVNIRAHNGLRPPPALPLCNPPSGTYSSPVAALDTRIGLSFFPFSFENCF